MAFVHGKATTVYLGPYNITGYCDSADIGQVMEPAETTTFGAGSKTYIAGLRDGTASLTGNADYSTGAIDDVLNAAIDGSQKVLTIGFNGDTIGNRCRMMLARQTAYNQSIPVGDKVSWSADLQADGGVDAGVFLHALGAETGTGAYTSVDNGASSTNGWAANVHVTAVDTLTGATLKVQHSSDNASWSDLGTFTNITAATAEQITGTGTVNRYVRGNLTSLTGTGLTFALSFSRR